LLKEGFIKKIVDWKKFSTLMRSW